MVKNLSRIRRKSFIYGILASTLLVIVYFVIVSIFQGTVYAISRFFELWYFMFPLVIGFGFQIGLFTYIRNFVRMTAGTAGMSGCVSTVSMVACCAHHITDVIPILGVSAIGIFLLEYQPLFLAVGIVFNSMGIMFMLNVAKESGIKFRNGILKSVMKYDYGKLMKVTGGIGAIGLILLGSFLGYQWYQRYYGTSYNEAVSSELENKCVTPSGYTDDTWRGHMSHHPDRYAECLK